MVATYNFGSVYIYKRYNTYQILFQVTLRPNCGHVCSYLNICSLLCYTHVTIINLSYLIIVC